MKVSFADILKQVEEESSRKISAKVPEWAGVDGLVYPTKLCTEQCSSSETAHYKAAVAAGAAKRATGVEGGDRQRIADLTGGLGVDSWAFSQQFREVFYNEMNMELANGVRSNFEKLGIINATVHSSEIVPGNIREVLGGFTPDVIYLDPARRSDTGKKVFMVEDCRPDILNLRDELLGIAPVVVVKLSPMADISLLAKQLGDHVSDIHVIGAGGECKELLVIMDREHHPEYRITVAERGHEFSFLPSEEDAASVSLATTDDLSSKLLFEPGKALMKAGAYNLLCSTGLRKLGRSTHLYIADEPIESLVRLGKWYSIVEVRDMNNRTIKELGKQYCRCELTARNIPMTTEQLRKKMGVTSGGSAHIFALHCDASGSNLMIVTSRYM